MPFDPNAPARVTRGRQRGNRWRLVFAGAVALGVGAIVAQEWVTSTFRWRPEEARPDVIPAHAEPAVWLPAEVQAPAPPPPAPAPKRAPALSRPAPRLPTRIAWDARPSAEPDMAWFHDG